GPLCPLARQLPLDEATQARVARHVGIEEPPAIEMFRARPAIIGIAQRAQCPQPPLPARPLDLRLPQSFVHARPPPRRRRAVAKERRRASAPRQSVGLADAG